MPRKPIRVASKTELVAEALRLSILRGELKGGLRLYQQALADELGTSTTPIREAFRQLEAEGLLVFTNHKGVCVADFGVEDAEELYLIRLSLESLATRVAVEKAGSEELTTVADALDRINRQLERASSSGDVRRWRSINREFHSALYAPCKFPTLLQMIASLWSRFPWDVLWVIPGRLERSISEHERIVRALRARDPDGAAVLVTQHLGGALEAMRRYFEAQRGGSTARADGSAGASGLCEEAILLEHDQ